MEGFTLNTGWGCDLEMKEDEVSGGEVPDAIAHMSLDAQTCRFK